ncbi:MAG: DNA polymerase, partial [Candidatus Cloacimonetes bacterium]|nr:DNA polymerase [Candidatus Cloacimonadota bacterium]
MIKLTMTPNLRVAKFGLKKTVLSLTDEHDCRKCKLRKEVCPVYVAPPPKRVHAKEKVVLVLADHATGSRYCLDDAELRLINESTKNLKVDSVYIMPVVKCLHNKTPTKLMIESCESRLRIDIESLKPDVIVCLGKGPATLFNISGQIDKIKGGAFDVVGLAGVNAKLIITQPIDKVVGDISLRSEFFSDFKKAERFCSKVEIVAPEKYNLCETPEEFNTWVEKVIKNSDKFVIAADIETNGRDMHSTRAKMRSISFSWAKGYALCVPFEDDPEGYLPGLRLLFSSNVRFIFHNGVFDMSFLKVVYGIVVANFIADTMLQAYLLSPGKGKYGYGLKPLSLEHTDLGAYATEMHDVEDDEDHETTGMNKWEKVPMLTLATYNCCDTDATLQIYKKFWAELVALKMTAASDLLAEATYVVCDLQINGVLLDREFIAETTPKLEALLVGYEEELVKLAGAKYDWNSPKELGKLLYEVLGYANPYGPGVPGYPTDDEALDRINTPFTSMLRKHRKCSKLCNTYFKGYFSKVESDGRLRANYWLCSTATGRTSSEDPNLQNLPRG